MPWLPRQDRQCGGLPWPCELPPATLTRCSLEPHHTQSRIDGVHICLQLSSHMMQELSLTMWASACSTTVHLTATMLSNYRPCVPEWLNQLCCLPQTKQSYINRPSRSRFLISQEKSAPQIHSCITGSRESLTYRVSCQRQVISCPHTELWLCRDRWALFTHHWVPWPGRQNWQEGFCIMPRSLAPKCCLLTSMHMAPFARVQIRRAAVALCRAGGGGEAPGGAPAVQAPAQQHRCWAVPPGH